MAKNNEITWTIAKYNGRDIKFVPQDTLFVNFINQDINTTITITNPKLAFINDQIVTDNKILNTISINATIVQQSRGPKVVVYKSRRRKNSARKHGHRQDLTLIRIDNISNN